jgi:hypothetical protein
MTQPEQIYHLAAIMRRMGRHSVAVRLERNAKALEELK